MHSPRRRFIGKCVRVLRACLGSAAVPGTATQVVGNVGSLGRRTDVESPMSKVEGSTSHRPRLVAPHLVLRA
jgi:hypothetical protein